MTEIKKWKWLFYTVIMLFFTCSYTSVTKAENRGSNYNGGPIRIIYDAIGHYALNYTGNTNHYDYWNTNGTSKRVNRNYKDRTDISTLNNSTAVINKTDSQSAIKKAYLIWQSRAENAPIEPVVFITPNNSIKGVIAEDVCQDVRTNGAGQEYVGVYTMVADVTSIVCSENGGYGTYTVANIPVWDGVQSGEVSCGGESVASWQLVVVEESPNFPLRTISMNTMSQYFYNVDYTVRVNFADASSPNGVVTAQFLDGSVDVDGYGRYDGIGYEDDYNYEYEGGYYRYYTKARGLYKNGICFNNRDTGSWDNYGSNAIGGIRVHLFDDYRRSNSAGAQTMTYKWAGKNMGINVFLFGVSIDVFAYDIVFDGNGANAGQMEKLSCIYSRDYNLPKNAFRKDCYTFAGWNTKSDGNGTWYTDEDYIYNLTSTEKEVTLYAQWRKQTYRITLNNQYATYTGTRNYFEWYGVGNYATNDCVTPLHKITIPQKKAHSFAGYYTGKNGTGTCYVDASGNILSTATTFASDTTLYAHWIPAVYKITLDSQGANYAGTTEFYEKFGIGNYTASNCVTPITQITNPQKRHYTFAGYYTEPNGNGQKMIDVNGAVPQAYTLFDKDTTLYACWEPVTYTITLDGQGATNTGTHAFYEKYSAYNYIIVNQANESLGTTTQIFNYTGNVQYFVAPYTGRYELNICGASGENPANYVGGSLNTYRIRAIGYIDLVVGDVLCIYCGGQGVNMQGGWNGGGDGTVVTGIYTDFEHSPDGYSGNVNTKEYPYKFTITAGGGATDIRKGGNALSNRIILAAGTGGGIYNDYESNGQIKHSSIRGNYCNTALYGNVNSQSNVIMLDGYMSTKYYWLNATYNALFFPEVDGPSSGVAESAINSIDSISYINNGGFGNAGYGGGGGWYGGNSFIIQRKAYQGSTNGISRYSITPYATTTAGSSYLRGTENGWLEFPASAGNGFARISYTNYSTSIKITNSIDLPKKTGYRFGGYYTGVNGTGTCYVDAGGNILSSTTTFTSSATLYAHWIPSGSGYYQVAFNGNGADGGRMDIMTCAFNTNYALYANGFTKAGYTFAGWSTMPDGAPVYGNQQVFNNLTSVDGDVVTLYAQWNPAIVTYRVDYYLEDIDGGYSYYWGNGDLQALAGNVAYVSWSAGDIQGFTFDHAEVDGITVTEAIVKPDSSLVINMFYTRNSYTVTLNKDGGIGSVIGTGTYKYQEEVEISASVLDGYSWHGWSGTYNTTENPYRFTMPAQNVVMTASTSPVIFKITLDNQRPTEFGTMAYYERFGIGNYTTSACTMAITQITLPKKEGYIFSGYYSHRDGKGSQYIDANGNILASSTAFVKDTTLYAYWVPITYIIRFEGNGSTGGSMNDLICSFDMLHQLPKNAYVKTHYSFNCWNTESDGSGITYTNGASVQNLTSIHNGVITLYAQWIPNQYTIHFDANGGEGFMEDVTVAYDQVWNLPLNRFTRNNGYGDSTFLGWNVLADTREVLYRDGAEVVNMTELDGSTMTLYAIWDDCPWIIAEDLYYTLEEAQNGAITYEELMNQATAADREDGSDILPGIDEEKGTSFTIIDYLPSDFTQFVSEGSITETYQVIDSIGNKYKQMITVYVVDTTAVVEKPIGTTRFINEKYYNESYENGGLEENSVWKTNPEYVQIIYEAFENSRNNTPLYSYDFSHDELLKMKKFIEENGFGNFTDEDSLRNFYERFIVPNTVDKMD